MRRRSGSARRGDGTEAPGERPELATGLESARTASGRRQIVSQAATTISDTTTPVHTSGKGHTINVRS